MAIAEMRLADERAVKNQLGKLDRGMKAVDPLVRRVTGGRELLAGPVRDFFVAQIPSLPRHP
jgi:hypothetical protein